MLAYYHWKSYDAVHDPFELFFVTKVHIYAYRSSVLFRYSNCINTATKYYSIEIKCAYCYCDMYLMEYGKGEYNQRFQGVDGPNFKICEVKN